MSKLDNCSLLIQNQFGISPERANEIAEQIQSERFRLEAEGIKKNIDSDMAKFITNQADIKKLDAINAKKMKVQDLKAVAQTIDNMDERLKANPKMSVVKSLEAEMAGLPQVAKSHDTIELNADTKANLMTSSVLDELRFNNISEKLLQQEEFYDQVTRKLLGSEIKDASAIKAAEIIRKHSDIFYTEAKKWRPDLKYLKNHVKQKWYPDKMLKVSPDEWARDISNVSDIKDIDTLKEMYDDIINGNTVEDFLPEIKFGAGKTGESIVKSREIHIKDPDNWMNIAKKYGDENGISSTLKSMYNDYYTLGIIEKVGVRPQQNLIKAMKAAALKYPDRIDRKTFLKNIEGSKFKPNSKLWALWRNVDKSVHNVYNPSGIVHKLYYMESFRQNTSKLGGAQISALSDVYLGGMTAHFRGKPLLKAYSDIVSELFTKPPKVAGGEKTVAELAGVYSDNFIADTIYRFGPMADEMPGKLRRVQQQFFKWTGLTPWTDHMRSNSVSILSFDYAKKTKGGWEQLDSKFKKLLDQYGINKEQFNISGKHLVKDNKGRSFLDVSSIEDPVVRNNFYRMFADEANNSVVAPKSAELVWTNWGQEVGTVGGTLLRLAMKFKSFPISFGRRVMIPALREAADGDVGYLAHMLVGATTFGYISMTAKDIIRGNTPRPLDKWETFMAAMAQGGAISIAGDFLLQEYSRYGDSALEVAMGPTIGDISGLTMTAAGLLRGEVPKLKSVIREGIGATPFANIWYTRAAMNYLFLNAIYQSLDPAYMSRTKTRLNERGQEQFLEPMMY